MYDPSFFAAALSGYVAGVPGIASNCTPTRPPWLSACAPSVPRVDPAGWAQWAWWAEWAVGGTPRWAERAGGPESGSRIGASNLTTTRLASRLCAAHCAGTAQRVRYRTVRQGQPIPAVSAVPAHRASRGSILADHAPPRR